MVESRIRTKARSGMWKLCWQWKPNGESELCGQCDGNGQLQQVRQSILGQIMSTTVCPSCQGFGTLLVDPCSSCGGSGIEKAEKSFSIEVPKGVDTVTQRLSGMGPRSSRRCTRRYTRQICS